MTKCKDCKYAKAKDEDRFYCESEKFIYACEGNDVSDGLSYWDYENYKANFDVGPDFGCIHGVRADGLTECCETCENFCQDPFKRCIKDHFRFVSGEYTEDDTTINTGKMKCDEWAPKCAER